jgi:hypothetical protein
MKHEDRLLKQCLDNLQTLPNIQINYKPLIPTQRTTDKSGCIQIRSPLKSINYNYTIQPDITAKTADLVIAYFQLHQQQQNEEIILITNYLSEPVLEKLIKNKIEFIDAAGNVYLNNPAAYILIRGQRQIKEKQTSLIQITANSLQVIYILLKYPHILKDSQKYLSAAAGVTLATTKKTLINLYTLGYLQKQPEGKYRISNYTKLLERWEMGYAERLRPKFLLGSFSYVFSGNFTEISDKIIQQAVEDDFLIGGELGAAIATSYLIPTSAILHIHPQANYRAIAAKLKLKPNPEGNITFLQNFEQVSQNTNIHNYANNYNPIELSDKSIADPLLIHAELLLENSDRLRETAEILFTKFIQTRYTL